MGENLVLFHYPLILLQNLKRISEDIYYVPDHMRDKFPEYHPFLDFCDFYSNAITKDLQTATYKVMLAKALIMFFLDLVSFNHR